MDELKNIIAGNIVRLRQKSGMTQLELAEKLNYSDKAISKWERAASVPDITVLVTIAQLFEVPLDYLVSAEHPEDTHTESPEVAKTRLRNQSFITAMSITAVWLVAALVFAILNIIFADFTLKWLVFVFAIPISIIVWLVFNSVWFNRRRNFLIVSILMWVLLAVFFLVLRPFLPRIGLLFIAGIPGQLIIYFWSKLRHRDKYGTSNY